MFSFFDDMRVLFTLLPFVAVSILHLIFCLKKDNKKADVTKYLLMPLLFAAFFVITAGKVSAAWFSVMVFAALAFSWAGDIFLIFDKKQIFFIFGVLSFAVTQIIYAVIATVFLSAFQFPILFFSIISILFFCSGFFTVFTLRKALKKLIPIVSIYAFLISFTCVLFITLAFMKPCLGTLAAAAGGVCFVISDSMLAYSTFAKEAGSSRFQVMLTYLLAQFLIIAGMADFIIVK